MRIDVRPTAKQLGSYLDIKLVFNTADIDISPDECDVDGQIRFDGRIEVRDADTISLTGRLSASVRSRCGRCLEETVFDPEAEVSAVYIKRGHGSGEGSADEAEDVYYFDGNSVVPDNAFRDAFLLNIPVKVLCSEKCRGLCPICGCNLNEGTCDCPKI